MIKLQNVTKKYGDFKAVDSLTLEIGIGEVVGLLGPNGAGKSTTMKMISGFLLQDEGTIEIDNLNYLENEIEIKRKIGYMPENNPLYKEMRVVELLKYSAQLNSLKNIKERLEYVVEATNLKDVLSKTINQLSKGFKQRVGIAIALINNPKILILDEPTEGLDPNQRNEIRELIVELGKERTAIISTHVLQEVEAMCNRVIIINNGKVILDDSKKNVLNRATSSNLFNLGFKDLKGNFSAKIKSESSIKVVKKSKLSDVNNYQVSTSDSDKFFKFINEMIVTKEISITEISKQQTNLEEIFRELTLN